MAEAVETGKVTLGIASLRRSRTTLHFETLFEERLGIVCRSGDPLAKTKNAIGRKELRERTVLGNGISGAMETSDVNGLIPDAPIIVYNVLSLLALVRAGMGITILPHLSLVSARKGLSFVPLSDPMARRSVGLITRSIERSSPAEAAFVSELRRSLKLQAKALGIKLLA